MTVMVPGRLCWPVHRVATGDIYPDGFADVMDRWTLAEVVDACEVMDAIEEARARKD